ncbi:hypothetical protein BU17DRAFT_63069 [Hysterangium stoloniferum]|nr:hypothetical protein BU17DRAFT_63069 [Hysterangium stoloniferum]
MAPAYTLHRFIDSLVTPGFSCPSLVLTRNQFLCPPSTIDPGSLVSDLSNQPRHKPQDDYEYERITESNRQCFLFMMQLEALRNEPISRSSRYFYNDTPSHTTGEKPTTTTLYEIPPSPCKSRNRLLPPRPRLTSPLSPDPPHTLLPGPPRRPMPLKRSRITPMLVTALHNSRRGPSQRGRSRLPVNIAPQIQPSDADEEPYSHSENRLKKSWMVPPRGDWEDDWVVVEPGGKETLVYQVWMSLYLLPISLSEGYLTYTLIHT